MTDGTSERAAAWLFVRPDAVPAQWHDRAEPMALIPLVPEEVRHVLGTAPDVEPGDVRLVRLAARGRTAAAIARDLGVSSRTVERRLAALRQEFGVGSTAELAVALAGRGFAVSEVTTRPVGGSAATGTETQTP